MLKVFSRLKLREKILIASIVIATIPFIVTNVFWYINGLNVARDSSKQVVQQTANQAAQQINEFLNTKLLGFLSHSQGAALVSGDRKLIQNDLSSFLLQDPDITTVSVASASGQEVVKIDTTGVLPTNALSNVSATGAFKTATFQYGKEYIGPIQFDKNNNPSIIIAVPIAYPQNAPILQTFTSENVIPRKAGEITGVLIGTVKLNRLFENINTIKVGESGFVYIIDNQGTILTHKDGTLIGNKLPAGNTEIEEFLQAGSLAQDDGIVHETKNSAAQDVLSTSTLISRTGWGVIVEQPLSDIAADIYQIQQMAIPVFMLPLIVVFIISFIFSKRITGPLKNLVKAAEHIGKGDFDYKFSVNSNDELGTLATAYRQMAANLKQSRDTLQIERNSLELERNTLASVLSNIDDGVLALDNDFRIIFLNQAAEDIFSLKASDATHKQIDTVIKLKSEIKEVTIASLCEAPGSKHKDTILTYGSDKNDHKVLAIRVSKSSHVVGAQLKYLITVHDVTKVQQLEEMKLDFVSMAAHELRTPLTAIRGYVSMFNDEKGGKLTKDQKLFISRINLSAEHLMALVENMLNVSRIERGVLTMDMRPTKWQDVINENVEELLNRAKERKISISVIKPNKQLSEVLVDKFRISQVVINLITNAINYTPAGGKVVIWTEEKEHEIITHIQDTGHGIPKQALPHLFSKFFRVSGSLEQGSKGTGLGLYISKSIVTSHKGKIWVTSEINKGSTFSFSVPKA